MSSALKAHATITAAFSVGRSRSRLERRVTTASPLLLEPPPPATPDPNRVTFPGLGGGRCSASGCEAEADSALRARTAGAARRASSSSSGGRGGGGRALMVRCAHAREACTQEGCAPEACTPEACAGGLPRPRRLRGARQEAAEPGRTRAAAAAAAAATNTLHRVIRRASAPRGRGRPQLGPRCTPRRNPNGLAHSAPSRTYAERLVRFLIQFSTAFSKTSFRYNSLVICYLEEIPT
uniref:Uncharacterized protein n=1 Tax=Peromyscus maniculatus bairdii TaxID=230844 RepID=A0A8C8UN68_PERMB